MFEVMNSETSRYRKCVNENIGFYNLNTFYTFDNVFDIICKYLKYKTECFLDRELVSMELPDRDRSNQDIRSSDKTKLSKNICPRGVMLYNIDPTEEDLVDIPTLKTHFAMNNGMSIALESVKKRTINDGTNIFDALRDINITISGNISYTSTLIYYTILLDNKIESIELMKQMKMNFPVGVLHDVYRYIARVEDTTGKTNNTGNITNKIDLIPHTLKTAIPDSIITKLKETLCIDTEENSDDLLETIMCKYSFNGLKREIDGSTRKPVWFSRFTSIPILVPTSITRSDTVKDLSSTSAVRVEFQLNYLEINAYKLRSSLNILSPVNPNNFVDTETNDNQAKSYSPFNVLKTTEEIDNCVRDVTLELSYEESDYYSSTTDEEDPIMKIEILDFITDKNKYLGQYLKYIQDSLLEEDSDCYKVIIKHASNQTVDVDEKTSTGTYYSYDDLSIYDEVSEPNDRVFVIVYVDLIKFVTWKRKMGFVEEDNLSTKYMKK